MPLYVYNCQDCRSECDVFKPIAQIDREERCLLCDRTMSRVIKAPAVVADYAGYPCPVSGKWIEGRKAHEENLKRTGCRLLEPGEKESVARASAQRESSLEQSIENTVDEFIATAPIEKREKLASEMEAGVSAQTVRA